MIPESESDVRNFDSFITEVRQCLSGDAEGKGYNSQGPDGDNHLYQITGPEHATGEVMYKAIRYRRKNDPMDMVKAAAWAFLVWKHAPPSPSTEAECTCEFGPSGAHRAGCPVARTSK